VRLALAVVVLLAAPVRAERQKVAVLEFEIGKGLDLDRTYFSDKVRGAVQERAPQLFVMTRESTEVLLKQFGKTLAECAGECEVETGRKLGADYVVSGRITKVGSRLALTMRLHATASGELLKTSEALAKNTDALVDAADGAVATLLGPLVAEAPPRPAAEAPAPAPAPAPSRRPAVARQGRPLDSFGDPLPAGAVLRLGKMAHGCGKNIAYSDPNQIAMSSDGSLALGYLSASTRFFDAGTGRLTQEISYPGSFRSGFAVSSDGRTLAMADDSDTTVRLWDVASGRHVRSLSGHKAAVHAIAFAPDGKTIATGAWDETVRTWDVASGNQLEIFQPKNGYVGAVAFAPDGRSLVAAAQDLQSWDLGSGTKRELKSGYDPTQLAFSADGAVLAVGSYGAISAYRFSDGTQLFKTAEQVLNSQHPSSVAFAPDGKTIAASDERKRVIFIDAASGIPEQVLENAGSVVAYSPDGKLLAVGGPGGCWRLWNTATLGTLDPGRMPHDAATTVAWSPDGKWIASGGKDRLIFAWDASSGDLVRKIEPDEDSILHVAFSADGKLVSSGENGRLHVWNVTTGRPVMTSEAPARSSMDCCTRFVLSADRKTIAYLPPGEKQVRFKELATGADSPEEPALRARIDNVSDVYTADGTRRLESRGRGVEDAATGKPILDFNFLPERSYYAGSTVFSPNGKLLAVAAKEQVEIWDLERGKLVTKMEGDPGLAYALAFSPDGTRLATAHPDGTILVWRVPR